nr:hypothetical protein CFP56_18002 [Quercus suber]
MRPNLEIYTANLVVVEEKMGEMFRSGGFNRLSLLIENGRVSFQRSDKTHHRRTVVALSIKSWKNKTLFCPVPSCFFSSFDS